MIERVIHCTKRPVVILGVTGTVGQRFVEYLADHPWFEIAAVMASERSVGRPVDEARRWLLPDGPPASVGRMTILPMDPAVIDVDDDGVRPIAFSALPADVARDVEPAFAEAGYAVFSNASTFRYDEDVPLLIPEVNADHAALLALQRQRRGWGGF
ncbi:aspartate-semialdehyde dehydrogenase, partial [Candidatus Bipolaricaulota bacterium]|nr:aspartate-semialdehyde dehydrogenase [Candidatus Bipolaricaulota bacterium]